MPKLPDECWAITDHAAGNQRQALALATQMHCAVRHLQLEPRAPWSWLAPHWLRGGRIALPPEQRTLFAPPWPGMAIQHIMEQQNAPAQIVRDEQGNAVGVRKGNQVRQIVRGPDGQAVGLQ